MTSVLRLVTALLTVAPLLTQAADLSVAVATNFLSTARELGQRFENVSGYRVTFAAGSTGKLYAQIVSGAPFDVLLAADADRPQRLEEAGVGIRGSRFTYARGTLVAWSRDPLLIGSEGLPPIDQLRRIAIANPALAPYGAAARDALVSLGIWEAAATKLVRGESIGQAFQFVATGNAELGLIARSQLPFDSGSHWAIPAQLHRPIDQQVIVLADSAAAREFCDFLRGDEARRVMLAAGYTVPGD